MKKLTIQAMRRLAKARGGRCLSDIYVSDCSKLLWQCAKGHQWMTTPAHIRQGHWCPECARGPTPTIDDMQHLAAARGGKCLSDTYVDSKSKLLWQCAKGHQWTAPPARIKFGGWCPHCCGKAKSTIQQMRKLARSRGGRCLSRKYVNAHSKLTWQCAKGHQWMTAPTTVQKGSWCPVCTGSARLAIDQMHQLAATRGGKCLSDFYVNSRSKLLWRCAKGHRWMARPSSIKSGQWCPRCHSRARLTIQHMRRLAKTRGGMCLSDVYVNAGTNLLWQCANGHQWTAIPNNVHAGSWCPTCARSQAPRLTIQEMHELAESRGGKCLSSTYVDNCSKLLWQCTRGHKWEASPYNIKRGTWCPKCRARRRLTLEQMKGIASSRGGLCLSDEYVNSSTYLLWQCSEGHQWSSTPNKVKRGSWCPVCWAQKQAPVRRLGLPAMQAIAASRGGLCLSTEYVNKHTHLLWQCREGHQWKAAPKSVKGGTWCPVCWAERRGPVRRLGLPAMQALAASRGGLCLSTEYVNNRVHLLWQCSQGHQWRATPNSMRMGSWCPRCFYDSRRRPRHGTLVEVDSRKAEKR